MTKDPELRYTVNGTALCKFSIAVNRRPSADGSRQTDFITIATWSKTAELCAEYLTKGRLVAVEGSIRVEKYENKEGQKRTSVEIYAHNVQFLDKPSGEREGHYDPSWDHLGKEVDAGDHVARKEDEYEDDIPF